MERLEFTADLTRDPILRIPPDVAEKLPKSGRARVIVLPIAPKTSDAREDAQWRAGAYEQFVREEACEDAVYDE